MRDYAVVLAAVLAMLSCRQAMALPVFPGAEGWGTETLGGRGGKVYIVDTLAGTGKGSFYAALKATGPRIVVFRVSGVIDGLDPALRKAQAFLTVAGQTSPGGVTFINSRNSGWLLSSYPDGSNNGVTDCVFRFLRLRALSNSRDDAASFNGCANLVFDHCEFSGGQDECFSVPHSGNFTIQWCAIQNSTPDIRGSGWGGTLLGYLSKFSLHHNLWAHENARYPNASWDQQPVDSGLFDLRNNIIYNPATSYHTVYTKAGAGIYIKANMVGNLYIEGPSTADIMYSLKVMAYTHAEDLWVYKLNGQQADLTTAPGLNTVYGMRFIDTMSQAWPMPQVTTYPAAANYDSVLTKVGALPRDTMMRRTVEEVRARTGVVKNSTFNPLTYAPLPAGPFPEAPADADNDGMPDFWETGMGLDPADSADNVGDLDGDGYTNIEEYINDLADARLCRDYRNAVYPIPADWPDYNPECAKYLANEKTADKPVFPALAVYPSPFRNRVALNFAGSGDGPVILRIFDVRGKAVADLSANLRDGTVVWDVVNQPAGIYFVRVTWHGKNITKPVLHAE